jgi:hypothetical protein
MEENRKQLAAARAYTGGASCVGRMVSRRAGMQPSDQVWTQHGSYGRDEQGEAAVALVRAAHHSGGCNCVVILLELHG